MHLCLVILNMKLRPVALFVHCLVVQVLPAKKAGGGISPVMC
jgi:hypothetical protein